MKHIIGLWLLAHLGSCQVESSATTTSTLDSTTSSVLETPSIIDSVSPTTREILVTPTTSDELPTETLSSSTEPLITTSTTTDELTLVSSTTSFEDSTSVTDTTSSTPTATDDEVEITITGTIQPESTADADLGETYEIPRELTPDESVAVTALEVETYADLLVNAPLEVLPEDPPEDSIVALPACPVSGAALEKRQFSKPPKRPKFYPCMPNTLTVEVIYHYVQPDQKSAEDKGKIRTRVAKQHVYFVKALSYYGVTIENGELQFKKATAAAKRFTDHYKSNLNTPEAQAALADNNAYRKRTRVGGSETLNVWIVDKLRNDDENVRLNGYAQFPEYRQFETDGIVLSWQALRSEDDAIANAEPKRRGSVLVHEFGHWMGLYHTFGDTPCTEDDGISDTFHTSNARPALYDDYQEICGTNPVTFRWISNYMSYSKVMATYIGKPTSYNPKSFTKGQRAAMFARFYAFRGGVIYRADYCKETKKRSLMTRTEAHALQRRAEDKARVLADLLLSNCSIAIQDVYQEDTIPLPASALASYSSAASSMAINPTSNANMFAPKTATIGAGTAVAAPTGSSTTGSASSGQSGSPSLGVEVQANWFVAVFAAAACMLVHAWTTL